MELEHKLLGDMVASGNKVIRAAMGAMRPALADEPRFKVLRKDLLELGEHIEKSERLLRYLKEKRKL